MAQAVRPKVQTEKTQIRQTNFVKEKVIQRHLEGKVSQNVKFHPVTESESIALVKNVVSAVVGSLAYLRGLFDLDNFVDDSFDPPDDSSKKKTKGKKLSIKRLKTNISPEADVLSSWIVCNSLFLL